MSKNDFLKKLERSISFLEKEEIEKVLTKYEKKYEKDNNIKLDVTLKEICEDYKLNYKEFKARKYPIKEFYDDLVDLGTILKKEKNKRWSILLDLLILVVVTCILKVPFIFIRELGDSLVEAVFNSNTIILTVWGLLLEFVYVIVGLSFFFKTFKKWFKSL